MYPGVTATGAVAEVIDDNMYVACGRGNRRPSNEIYRVVLQALQQLLLT